MDYIKPPQVVASMIEAGKTKANLSVRDMMIRGVLSGALLGFATSLAVIAALQTGIPLVGAIVFPVSFVIIVLLGLELVTGNFALLPMTKAAGKISNAQIMRNWGWVFLGNLLGSLLYAVLLWVCLTNAGVSAPTAITERILAIAEAKTTAYQANGGAGMLTVFVKAILCNWMVCMGVVMALASSSTIGKIAGAWLPIFIFFAQGYEHAVVNMFIIPAGMFFGAEVSTLDWWLWNQIPVTIGNLVGGAVFVGGALYMTYAPKPAPAEEPVPATLKEAEADLHA